MAVVRAAVNWAVVAIVIGGLGSVPRAMAVTAARSSAPSIVVGRPTILAASNRGTSAQVTIVLSPLPSASAAMGIYSDPAYYRPRTTLTRLDILLSGRKVQVPLSAIADLIDVHYAAIRPDVEGYVLALTGGDGAESYVVELRFNAKGMNSRVLRNEESGRWTERTIYRTIVD